MHLRWHAKPLKGFPLSIGGLGYNPFVFQATSNYRCFKASLAYRIVGKFKFGENFMLIFYIGVFLIWRYWRRTLPALTQLLYWYLVIFTRRVIQAVVKASSAHVLSGL